MAAWLYARDRKLRFGVGGRGIRSEDEKGSFFLVKHRAFLSRASDFRVFVAEV